MSKIQRNYDYELYYKSDHHYWWSVGRRDLIYRSIRSKTVDLNKIKILDIGVGSGEVLRLLQEAGAKAYGIDKSEESVRKAKEIGCLSLRVGNAENIPFNNNFFDFVLILDVLEHVEDEAKVLAEIFRVTKKGGYCLIIVSAFDFLWSSRDERLGHKRRYSVKILESKIKRAGFDINKITYYSFFYSLPMMAWIILKKLFVKTADIRTDVAILPNIINRLMIQLCKVENTLVFKMNLPWGFSIFSIARKTKKTRPNIS